LNSIGPNWLLSATIRVPDRSGSGLLVCVGSADFEPLGASELSTVELADEAGSSASGLALSPHAVRPMRRSAATQHRIRMLESLLQVWVAHGGIRAARGGSFRDKPPKTRLDDDAYAASADDLLNIVRGLDEALHTVVLVGHNPGIEELAEALTARRVPMPTSALAVIGFNSTWGRAGRACGFLRAAGRPPISAR
jgi:hypothetical protein